MTSNRQYKKPRSLPAVFRAEDLVSCRIPRGFLRTLLNRGEIERVSRGLYRVVSIPANENETILMVAKSIPGAIVCLLTALRYYQIGTQSSRYIWIALIGRAWKPRQEKIPLKIVRFSSRFAHYGIVKAKISGVPVRMTSPARTVIDCFRYRNKLGIDIALEALRDSVRNRKTTLAEIAKMAKELRMHSVMRPYLEAITS